MGTDGSRVISTPDWQTALPPLAGRVVTLREPASSDVGALMDLLSIGDACRFGLEGAVTELSVRQLIDGMRRSRAEGLAFTYVAVVTAARAVVGLIQVRQLEPSFESAEWECVVAPSWRGTAVFLETARLVGSFAFSAVGVYRLESRVLVQNGRANGAMRKIGAVEEGVLRRSTRRGSEYLDQVLWSVLKDDWSDHWVSTSPRVH